VNPENLISELFGHVLDHFLHSLVVDGVLVLGDGIKALKSESEDTVFSLSNPCLFVLVGLEVSFNFLEFFDQVFFTLFLDIIGGSLVNPFQRGVWQFFGISEGVFRQEVASCTVRFILFSPFLSYRCVFRGLDVLLWLVVIFKLDFLKMSYLVVFSSLFLLYIHLFTVFPFFIKLRGSCILWHDAA